MGLGELLGGWDAGFDSSARCVCWCGGEGGRRRCQEALLVHFCGIELPRSSPWPEDVAARMEQLHQSVKVCFFMKHAVVADSEQAKQTVPKVYFKSLEQLVGAILWEKVLTTFHRWCSQVRQQVAAASAASAVSPIPSVPSSGTEKLALIEMKLRQQVIRSESGTSLLSTPPPPTFPSLSGSLLGKRAIPPSQR